MSHCTKEITEQHIQLSMGLGARVVHQVSLQKCIQLLLTTLDT